MEALDALPRTENVDQLLAGDTTFGVMLFAAGEVDRALPVLTLAAARCTKLPNMTAWFFLGEARAAKGDVPGACEAFAVVTKAWGKAKPQSVTATDAAVRAKALGCPER